MENGHITFSCRSDYRAGGWGHRALHQLSDGPMTMDQMREIERAWERGPRRRKHWYAVSALKADGLVRREVEIYSITTKGREMLAHLNRLGPPEEPQRDEAPPSVRIFARPDQ